MGKHQVVVRRNGSNYKSTASTSVVQTVRYAECQKNHAANVGGYAVGWVQRVHGERGGGDDRGPDMRRLWLP